MRYIDLPKPHGYLIWRGKQKALVSPVKLPTDEKMLVIQEGHEAFGEVVLSTPSQISLTEFERLEEEHSIRPEERKLSWPDQKAFFFYRFKEWQPYLDSKDVEIENGQAQVLPEIELSEDEKQLLEKAERLPKTLILKDEAVVLEDGKAIFCEGLDGSQIMPILSTYFDNKEINETLPLYQLALVRMPKLKLKKNMEVNMEQDEKAEGTKPYKIVENHSGCKEEGLPVGVVNQDGKLMGCSEDMDKAGEYVTTMIEEDKGRTSSTKKPKRAGSRKSKKELAQALVEALVEEDEPEVEEGEKEQSLSSKVSSISDAFRQQFNPKPPDMPKREMYYWVKEIFPDYAVIGCEGKMYKVGYSIDEEGNPKFADKSKWAELEVQLVPTGNIGAKSIMEGYSEDTKSFSDWVTDYYEFGDKSITDLTEEEAIKAVWSTAFVNGLPDSSFLHIVPDCGSKDDEGKTKPRSCRMFPYKTASGEVDLPHLRNAIARAPQASTIPEDVRTKIQKKAQGILAEENKEEEGEKAGRKVKKTMLEKVKKAWETIKEFMDWAEPEDDEEEEMGMSSLFNGKSAIGIKKIGNEYWYVTYSTNAFKDREKEIFSTKSLEKYVSESQSNEDKGHFNFWHIPETDFARKEWQGVAGRFLIEAGPFLKDKKGQAALKFFKQYSEGHPQLAPEGWGCSPEYKYLPEERKKGIYENIWITRTSTLPKMAAANIWTNGGITMALTAEQKKSLETIFGEDEAKQIISTAETKTKELEEAGVAHKEVSEEVAEEEVKQDEKELVTEDVIIQKVAEKLTTDWEPVTALLQQMNDNQKALESKIEMLENELKGAKSEEAKKAKTESPKYVWSLVQRASEADKTIVPDEDPLKGMKPAEAQKSDKSGASAFFGGK